MISFDKASFSLSVFREAAEKKIQELQLYNSNPANSPIDIPDLIQLQLQLQNEALMNAMEKQQEQLDKYAALLKSAPSEPQGKMVTLKSDEKYKMLIEQAYDGVLIYNGEGVLLQWNEKAQNFLGYSHDEFKELRLADLFFKEELIAKPLSYKKLKEGAAVLDYRKLKKKDGTGIEMEINSKMLSDGTVIVFGRDITQRITAATALKRAYEILEETNKIARVGGYEVDLKSGKASWTSVTCEICEVPPDYKPDFNEVFNFYKEGESRKTLKKLVNEAIRNGMPFDTELMLITARGNERWIRVTGRTEFENGNCIRLYGSFQDIHYRKLAQEELAAKEKYFRALIEHSSSAIVLFDDKGNFIYQSPIVEKILGYLSSEREERNLFDFIHPDDNEHFFRQMIELISRPGTIQTGCFRFRHTDGHYVWLEGTVTNRLTDRNVGALIANYQDVSERKVVEGNLQSLNAELAKQANALSLSNSELERFAYVASHDLQEPLRMVSSFLKLLETKYKSKLDDTAKQYIHFAVDGADRMKLLIHDLLEYSRVSTNKDSTGNTDMNMVVKDVISILMIGINELDADIQVGTLPVLPNTNRTLLFQLMQNLLGNALKYHSAERPVITISAKDEYEYWEFAIADNGIGINPDFAEKIFVIFQRLHNKDQYSGTGIGLSICKKIVEMHGGKIWVESAPGGGSIFYFTLKK